MRTDTGRALVELQSDGESGWHLEWDRGFNQIRTLRGRSTPRPGDAETVAAAFLRDRHALFGLPFDLEGLTLASRRESPMGTHLAYEQTWNGLVVHKGGIDVHVSRAGEVFLVHNRYVTPDVFAGKSAIPMLAAADAVDAARAALAVGGPAKSDVFGAPTLVLFRGRGTVELAYRITLRGRRYVVSAATGAVLESTPTAQRMNGRGRVFVFDPDLIMDVRTLLDIRAAGNPLRYRLEGPRVRLFDAGAVFLYTSSCYTQDPGAWGPPVGRVPPRSSQPVFVFTRAQDGFAHTNVYFHIDRNQRYVQVLGFTNLLANGIRADAHAFAASNAYFCPAEAGRPPYLAFGDGGVDDAEDPDVVLHEYGHALQDASSSSQYLADGETGAMAEGFADYWAFSNKPAALGTERACLMHHANRGTCLRRVDTSKTRDDFGDDTHDDAEIWSRALYDVFNFIGNKQVADRLVLQSHFLVPTDPDFVEGAQALLLADEHAGGTYKRRICQAMLDRRIVDPGPGLIAYACPMMIEGHVRGPGGIGIPGAVVRTSLDTRSAATNPVGHFILLTNTPNTPQMCCTPYTITVSAAGYRTYSVTMAWGAVPTSQVFNLVPR